MEAFFRKHEHTLKIFALACVALFTLLEYLDFKKDQKIQKTIKFNDAAYQKHVVDLRFKLESGFSSRKVEIENFASANEKKKLSDEQNLEAVLNFVAKMVKEDGIEGDVLNYFDFFTTLQKCIDTEVCDSKTAKLIYGSNPRDIELLDSYCIYIIYYRKILDSPTYATAAINLVGAERCEW